MSETMELLRRKISGAGDLESVVRSMKALAASSIGQYEKAVESLHDYYRTVALGLAACLLHADAASPGRKPDLENPATKDAIIFGSDQGLVGRFNESLLDYSMDVLSSLPGKIGRIRVVGERMHALVVETGRVDVVALPAPTSVDAITHLVGEILISIESARDQGVGSRVHVFHNRPQAGALYEPVGLQLLPLDEGWRRRAAALPWPTKRLPQVVGDPSAVQRALLREYLFVVLFQACAESLASENASRLAAMQRAERNIQGILGDLNGRYRRVRQESIDEELFDVIAGYEATARKKSATGPDPVAGVPS